jgi:hypothetical protein
VFVAQLHFDHDRPTCRLDREHVDVPAAQQDLAPEHHDPWCAAERQQIGCRRNEFLQRLLVREPVGPESSHPDWPSGQIAVTNHLQSAGG